jgi:esterase/lipase superfamily enzyme
MKNYIITNRKIIYVNGKETISDDANEMATDNIRFAVYDDEAGEINVIEDFQSDDSKSINYNIQKEDPILYGSQKFFVDLHDDMLNNKNDTLVFIHGFNTDLDTILKDIKNLSELYCTGNSRIGRVAAFVWPSYGNKFEYRDDRRNAEISGYALGRAYLKLLKFFSQYLAGNQACGGNIHLISHSMGNFVLEKMMEMVINIKDELNPIFKECLLIASDIDNTALELPKPLYRITDLSQRVHVYYNTGDELLMVSEKTKNSLKRLGKFGPANIKLVRQGINVVDVTDVVRTSIINIDKWLGHGYFLTNEKVVSDINYVLQGEHTEKIPNRDFLIHKGMFRLIQK